MVGDVGARRQPVAAGGELSSAVVGVVGLVSDVGVVGVVGLALVPIPSIAV
jgi:hypothetical protein